GSSAQALSLCFSSFLGYYSPGYTVHKIRTSDRNRQRIGSIGKAQPNRHSVSLEWAGWTSETAEGHSHPGPPDFATKGNHNAKTQTRKKQSRSLSPRARLHGNELFLWPTQRQAGDDLCSACRRGTWRHILRYR